MKYIGIIDLEIGMKMSHGVQDRGITSDGVIKFEVQVLLGAINFSDFLTSHCRTLLNGWKVVLKICIYHQAAGYILILSRKLVQYIDMHNISLMAVFLAIIPNELLRTRDN